VAAAANWGAGRHVVSLPTTASGEETA